MSELGISFSQLFTFNSLLVMFVLILLETVYRRKHNLTKVNETRTTIITVLFVIVSITIFIMLVNVSFAYFLGRM